MRSALRLLAVLAVAAGAPRARAQGVSGPRRLTLAQAVLEASANAPGVQLAGYQVDAAQARTGQSRADLLPSLSAAAGWFNHSVTLASTGFATVLPPKGSPTGIGVGAYGGKGLSPVLSSPAPFGSCRGGPAYWNIPPGST